MLRFPTCIVKVICILPFIFLTISAYTQQTIADSLQNELSEVKMDSSKIMMLLALSNTYSTIDIQKAIDYGQQAKALSITTHDEQGLLNSLQAIGKGYGVEGNLKSALDYFEEALVIAKARNDKKSMAEILNSKGVIHMKWGNNEEALILYHAALSIAEELKITKAIIEYLRNISTVHSVLSDQDKCIAYLERALLLNKNLQDKEITASLLSDIAIEYTIKEAYDTALIYFEEAQMLAEATKSRKLIAKVNTHISHFYIQTKNLNLAEKHLAIAIGINRQIGYKGGIAVGLLSMGDIKHQQGNYSEAKQHFLECLDIFQQLDSKIVVAKVYDSLSKNYAAQKNYEEAYNTYQSATSIRNTVFNEQKSKQIAKLSTEYETKQKEAENQLLKEQQIRNEIELRQKTIIGWVSGLILLLVSILAFILYRGNQQKQLYNQQLNTEVRLLNKNLGHQKVIESQAKRLQLAEEQKNKLFTNIAHELQTPLNIIQGLSKQLFQTESLTNTGYESLEIITRNSIYLSEASKQILATNLPSDKELQTEFVLFSLKELLDFILPAYQFLAAEKSIKLQVSPLKDANLLIYSDIEKLKTILKNLLSNAIKYTAREGTISITYLPDNSDFHEIAIKDNGQGIKEEELSTIFDRYFQSESQEASGGFGLGLAICKEYISALNGTITVKSQVGLGSTFLIRLPKTALPENKKLYRFEKMELPKPIILEEPIVTDIGSKSQLLIVEDNLDFCKYLEGILKNDYYLAFAHDGQQAIAYLENHKPALIITDWMMQGMDGLAFINYLKDSSPFHQLPTLMLTARSLTSDKMKALQAGVDDYLIKPIEAAVLKSRITQLLLFKEERESVLDTFPVSSTEQEVSASKTDQKWLIDLERTIFPLLSDFDLKLEKIAVLQATNVKQLNRKIKTLTGLTAKKYVQELRYWEARRLLETKEGDSVKSVCYSVGFKDTKYFGRKFKERFGVYPHEYL